MNEVTEIIRQIEQGNAAKSDELLPLVYTELRNLAKAKLANEKPGQTLQATALVHEAYLRLLDNRTQESLHWNSRGHFFGAAAEAMRRILVENARRKKAERHGGDRQRIELSENLIHDPDSAEELIQLSDAINELESENLLNAQLVKLRLFTGLTVEEAGLALEIPRATAYRKWDYCRAWLIAQLRD